MSRGSAAGRVAAALTLAATVSGCATAKRIARPAFVPDLPLRHATPEEVRSAFNAYCRRLETVSASGHLTVSDYRAGKSREVGIRLVARRGGKLYLKASVALVTALEVVSDGRSFWFSLPSKKTIWTGAASSSRTAEEVTDTDAPYKALRPKDIVEALLPEPLAPGPGDSLVFEADSLSFALTLVHHDATGARARRRVWLTRKELIPARLWVYDSAGNLETEVRFLGWRLGRPARLSVLRPVDGYEAAFSFDKFDVNVAVPDRAFVPRIPDRYKVKQIEG